MDKIKIKIDGRVAEIESAPEVVTDNAEYEVEFAVDERDGWNPAVPMTALFVRRDARYTAVVMDVGETICTMPPQTGTNVLYIGLTQEEMRTTTPARIPIRRSVRTMTDFPPLPDKDVYEQILANFAGLRMLSGKGAPTTETAGKVNQLYRDETNNRIYVCVNDVDGYTWAMIGGGGGGGTVVTIDTTLTKSGQAADAKAAGDAIGKKLDATALPTAVNDALAQAKASGAFDGAKGEKGDTGPVGPKGADGKDGAGMDVTGAKVGQIAKITAVDSAGNPTAWEAVDMPEEIEWVNATMTFDDNGNPSISTDISATEVIRRIKEGRCCVVRLTDGDFEFTMMQSSCDEHSASFTTILNNMIYLVGFSTNGNGSDNVILNTNSIGSMLFDLERNSDDPTKATLMYGITLYDINSAIGRNKIVYLRIGKNVYSWSEAAPGYKFSTIIEDGNELKYSRITLGGDGNPHSTNATIYEKVL